MQIKLKDGTMLDVLNINGRWDGYDGPQAINYQGMERDSLAFEFSPEAYTFDQLKELFGDESKTDEITILCGEESFLHEHYNLRKEIAQKSVEITPASGTQEGVFEERFTVTMAQENRFEVNLKSVRDDVDNVQIAMLESEGIL